MTKHIIMVFAGACSFGILSTFVKLAYGQGYTAAEISFSQAFTGMLVLWILAFLYNKNSLKSLSLRWASSLPVLLTGVAIGLTTYVYYLSVQYIAASLAIILLMQFTWMGMLLDWLLFRKKPGRLQVITIILILIGTFMASGMTNTGWSEISITGVGYALASAFLYAVYIVANSQVGNQVDSITKSALIMSGSAIGIFLFNAQSLVVYMEIDGNLVKWTLFLALFGTVIPPVLFAKGIPRIGAGISSIIMTAELPVAVISSHLVLKEQVDLLQWLGVLLMLLSMILLKVQTFKWKRRPVTA